MKKKKISLIIFLVIFTLSSVIVKAITTMDLYQYNTVKEVEDDKTIKNIISTNNDEVGVLIKEKKLEIEKLEVLKSGETTDTYQTTLGNNSALLVYKNSDISVKQASIATQGINAYGIFTNNSKLKLDNTEITTSNTKSTGIYTSNSEITINNLNLLTKNTSSPAIYDTASSNIEIKDSEIITENELSPAICTSGKLTIENTNIQTSMSQGIVIDSGAEVSLINTKLYTSDTSSSDNLREYKNIDLKQTKDSTKQTRLNITSSEITTESGTPFYITNKDTILNLKDNKILSNSLNVITIKDLNKSKDKIKAEINLDKQIIEGNVEVDAQADTNITMKNKSRMQGALLGNNKNIDVTIDKTSFIILTGDSYLANLNNEVKDNSNIYLNNHTLYVNGEKVEGSNDTPPSLYEDEIKSKDKQEETVEKKVKSSINLTIAIISIVITLVIVITIILIITIKRNKNNVIYK